MEVRLAELAKIIGTPDTKIRNDIYHDKLPFEDRLRDSHSSGETKARRTYSVTQAFLMFLQGFVSDAFSAGPWAVANSIRRAHRKLPIDGYIMDRVEGETGPTLALVIGRGAPIASGGLTQYALFDAFCNVGDGQALASMKVNYPVLMVAYLDPVFDAFVKQAREHGWAIDADGFRKISDSEA